MTRKPKIPIRTTWYIAVEKARILRCEPLSGPQSRDHSAKARAALPRSPAENCIVAARRSNSTNRHLQQGHLPF